ncbi:MAG: hypothetical protein ACRDQW_06770, partial [Haloechinothrix sp.]
MAAQGQRKYDRHRRRPGPGLYPMIVSGWNPGGLLSVPTRHRSDEVRGRGQAPGHHHDGTEQHSP